MSNAAELRSLGAGLGYREPFRSALFLHREAVDFLEVIAEHYLEVSRDKERELELLAAHFPLIPHGLDLSLGSAEGVDEEHLLPLSRLVRRLDPPWWSEHLSFTRAGGVEIGHLTPLPFTHEAVAAVCANIQMVRHRIDTPLILENVTYTLALPGAEMTEAEFLAEVLERSGCGLLLDVTNLYVNSVNHGYDPMEFLAAIPLERVVQLHFVGVERRADHLVDSHAHATPPEVWALLDQVLARCPVKGAVLERDLRLPPFREMADELERVRRLGRSHGRWT